MVEATRRKSNKFFCGLKGPIVVITGPVMQITKSIISGAGQVKPYDIITYQISYTNKGGATAEGVSIVDIIPGYTMLVTNSALIGKAVRKEPPGDDESFWGPALERIYAVLDARDFTVRLIR